MTSLDVTVLLHFHHVSAVYAIPATAPLGLLAVGCIHQEFIGAQNKKKRIHRQTDKLKILSYISLVYTHLDNVHTRCFKHKKNTGSNNIKQIITGCD